jgi:poly(3-hydroxybutyrate) depolymerase
MRRFAFTLVALSVVGCGRSHPLSVGGPAGAAGAGGQAGAIDATGAAGSANGAGSTGSAGDIGSAGVAGGTGVAGAPIPVGAGCGKPLPLNQVPTKPGAPTGYTHYTVMGTGATLAGSLPSKVGPRTFWVRVPVDYDRNHRYRVVYIGQGCGGYEVANTGAMQLFSQQQGGNEEAIYVALDIPRDMANQDCYDNRDGPSSQEWEAFELFHTVVDANYCVDNDNVFVSGYSTGAWLTNMWGCYFAGDGQHPWNGVPNGAPPGTAVAPRRFAARYHIRGQAANSGGEPDNNPPCNGSVAAIWIHDLNDANAYAGNHDVALPRVLKMNGCYSANPATAPWHEDRFGKGVCVQYTDCPAIYPVVFCTTVGQGHGDNHYLAIPAFSTFFDEATTP